MKYRPFFCPHCGRELQVPEDAESIVCMFCAQPIDLRAAPAAESADRPGGRAARLLPKEAFTRQIAVGDLNAKAYPGLFREYLELVRPALTQYLREAEAEGETAAAFFADAVVRGFSEQQKKRRQPDVFDYRFTITALLIPAILELKSPDAERLADRILEKWNAASPGRPLGKATFDTIQKGFRKKLCFITTAVCTELGKGDSCRELQEFRAFRDGWLASSPNGTGKIAEYYLFAPLILRAMRASPRGRDELRRIWRRHLLPCLSLIRAGAADECAVRYEKMMRELERKWLPRPSGNGGNESPPGQLPRDV